MKQLLLFACMLLTTAGLTAQTIYVNGAATGADDGTSWANAYSDLNTAFANAPTGSSVWIAAGTYITPADGGFFVDRGISILGGFAGTETAASAANPEANVTVLSGDVLQNDVAGTYDSLAYADNNRILLVADTNATSAFTVTIDGLTFANGGIAADGGTLGFAGAGLFLNAKADVSRCIFMNNRSSFGSALVIINPVTSGTTLDEVTFMSNYAVNGHNAYIQDLSDLTITNSTFTGLGKTSTNRDEMLRIIRVNDVTVDNCNFSQINGSNIRGAGIQFNNCDRVEVNNSSFDQIATTRGAVYVNGTPDAPDADPSNDMVVNNCTFTNVTASDRSSLGGGGNQNWQVNECTFENNEVAIGATGSAGFYTFGSSDDVVRHTVTFNDCDFDGNTGGRFGGAITLLEFGQASVDFTINGGTISNNTMNSTESTLGAGVYFQGAETDTFNTFTTNDVTFSGNVSRNGSAIQFNAPYDANFNNTTFANNGTAETSARGAAIFFFTDQGTVGATWDGCTFTENIVSGGVDNFISGGGCIYYAGPESGAVPLTMKNSTFRSNAAFEGAAGGVLQLRGNNDLNVDNCDFIDNSAIGEAGAILHVRNISSRDTTDDVLTIVYEEGDVNISNSSFLGNRSATQGGAISTQSSIASLTNNVFLGNEVIGGGASGGAIIFNGNAPAYNIDEARFDSTGSVILEADIVHNTFFRNKKGDAEGSVGSDIALFQGGTTLLPEDNSMTIRMLNNAILGERALEREVGQIEIELYQPTGNFQAGDIDPIGDLTVISLGGNYFNGIIDENITFGATNDVITDEFQDDLELETIFRDPFELDNDRDFPALELALGDNMGADNPLIDAGVDNALVPATDILGNDRILGDAPDIGAFESNRLVNVTDIEESGLDMSFFPNPTVDLVTIQNNDASVGKIYVLVTDQTGRLVTSNVFTGVNSRIDLTNVPSGVYNLVLLVEGKLYSKQIVKQ